MRIFLPLLFCCQLLCANNLDYLYDFDRLLFGNNEKILDIYENDYNLFKKVYLEKIDSCICENEEGANIPTVCHFIWIGPRAFPEESVKNVQSWMDLHPDWTFKFWTDSRARLVPVQGMEHHLVDEVSMRNGDLYRASNNYAEKSDILRYEILFQQGGVYVDHDVICHRPFDRFNGAYDFYAFLEFPHINFGCDVLFFPTNSLIGAIPNHPILEEVMRYVQDRWALGHRLFSPKTHQRRMLGVLFRTFHSFYLGVKDHLDDPNYENILLPPGLGSSHMQHFSEKEYAQLFCDHKFKATWVGRDRKPRKRK